MGKQQTRKPGKAGALLGAALITTPSFAQKTSGVFKVFHWDSPASMSIMAKLGYGPDKRLAI